MDRIQKNPLILGDSGFFNQGANSYTYYCSLTENTIRGSIRFKEISEEVSGSAWIDKQYWSFLSDSEESYEWLSANLSNGMDFVLWDLFTTNDRLPDTSTYRHMSVWVDSSSQYTTHDYQLERLTYAYMPDGAKCYAQKWRHISPAHQMDLIITTLNSHEDVLLPFRFYEGATSITGRVNGVPVTGKGFAELVKNYTPPEPAILYPQGGTWKDSLRIGWTLLNPDDGRNILYDLEYSTDGGSSYTVLKQEITENNFHWKNPADLRYGDSCLFKVQAYTTDFTLSGSVSSLHPAIYHPDSITFVEPGLYNSAHPFSVYPNPVKDLLNIEPRNHPVSFVYQIYDQQGIMVLQGEKSNPGAGLRVSMDDLNPGTYILRISAKGSFPQSVPFLKID